MNVLTSPVRMAPHASTLKEAIDAHAQTPTRESVATKMQMNVSKTTHVRMEQRVPTYLEIISVLVQMALKGKTATKISTNVIPAPV